MEIHPMLEGGVDPSPNLWYVLSTVGECPTMRIGHTCTHVPKAQSNGKLYFIGGANPNGTFAEVYVLDLDTHVWDIIECTGLKARYEHSAFVPSCQPDKIYIFGGADQYGNTNDIQVFDTVSSTWGSVTSTGNPPTPRIFHNGPCIGNRLIVYSGGDKGTDPVGDRQVYSYDAATSIWTTVRTSGTPPKPRLGHLMVAIGDKVFVHGGMSGTTFYGDLHILDLGKSTWTAVKQKKNQPPPRTGHSGFVSGCDIYIFGGMNRDGALDDFYKLDTVTMKWTQLKIEGAAPANRLDFASCVFSLKVLLSEAATEKVDAAATKDVVATATKDVLAAENKSDLKEQNGTGDSSIPLENENEAPDSEISHDFESGQSGSGACEALPENSAEEFEGQHLNVHMANLELKEAGDCADTSSAPYKIVQMGLVHGGTDTEGEIFEDTFVILLRTLS